MLSMEHTLFMDDDGLRKNAVAAALFSGLTGANCYFQPRTTSQHSKTIDDYHKSNRDVADDIGSFGR